ncbi:GNAT family N-acetyltransferase [Deinococcus sp. MIMF12]|uniref:GNAT family N-acetyltransferase n=1 Tax=Deinococcus rhizophilus TaxID=3049544 RepID=A0ABT7JE16_9DEIO|nr:GNAT family N-acetyltransferase [Deinococcus rhizophilus]MDL2343303.1 GNAT family N-acetyltransferase [Deinococcus rhizophilus]
MSSSPTLTIRAATPDDAFAGALLLNSTQEPHFHTGAVRLAGSFQETPDRYAVAETGGRVSGLGTLWFPEFHPTHAWVGLHLHPDQRAGGVAGALLEHLAGRARAAGRERLWASVREDYLPAWPDLPALGFREVHRTFGGGFHLAGWEAGTDRLEAALAGQGYLLTPAADFRGDGRLTDLYARTRGEKVSAEPTIPPAAETLTKGDGLWDMAWLAWHGQNLVGIALPERSRLDAWNAVLVVHPGHRQRGVATALLARVARSVQAGEMTFLNVAGSARDVAYLGVLRRLGANIEPDWIAWERGA